MALTGLVLSERERRAHVGVRVRLNRGLEGAKDDVVRKDRLLLHGRPARWRWVRVPAHAPPKASTKFCSARFPSRDTGRAEAPRKAALLRPVVAPLRCQRPVICMVQYSNTGTVQDCSVRSRPQLSCHAETCNYGRRGARDLQAWHARAQSHRKSQFVQGQWGTAVQVYGYEYSYAPTVHLSTAGRDLRYMYRDQLAKYFLHVEY